ncbi:MAG: NAD(P)-dependent oxidoreductase [Candidatus Diapherotrites archaeon]
MKFKQIVVLDDINITDSSMTELKKYSENQVKIFDSDPKDNNEIKERIADADCVLLSWRTPITKGVLSACKNLQFICLCGTNSDYIDLEECSNRNIVVSNIVDYGDEGVVEYILFQLLNLVRGFGKYQWKDYPAELSGKTIGIIGLGAVGKLLANTSLGFKMKVLYNSKTRKPEWEKRGLIFTDKKEILKKSDFIILQTPKNVKILEDVGLIERKKIGNTHVLAIKQEALEKIKKVWSLFEKSLIVKVPKTTTLLKALKKVPGLKIEENPDGAFITAVDGAKGYYIYEVNGKLPNVPANEFKINKDLDVELKKLIPVIGKRIKIKVE